MSMRLKVAVAVLAVGAVAAAVGVASANGVGSQSVAEPPPPALAPLSQETLDGLTGFDVTYEPIASNAAGVASQRTVVDVTEATTIARRETGIANGGIAKTASIGRITLGQYGPELEKDPTKPSRIDPTIENRTAWVIAFDRAPIPVYGPVQPGEPTVVEQPLVAFIDPTTGEFLAAISY